MKEQAVATESRRPLRTQQAFTRVRRFQCAAFLLLLFPALCASSRPLNILLFTADDLHHESVGAFGGRPKGLTPHLDRFAQQGMIFERAYVNASICVPSRSLIATGLYGHNSGVWGFMKASRDVPTVVQTFRRAGYLTGILGKVGHSTPTPSTRWDYQYDAPALGRGRSCELYGRRAAAFFRLCIEKKKPFYFMVNSHDPHRPFCNPQRIRAGEAPPSKRYRAGDVPVPGFLPDLPGVRQELAWYLNSTRRLDDTFGAVMTALKASKLDASTLAVFISDNGIAVPFAKCNTYYHSNRTPLIVRWPGVVKPGSRDRDHFVSVVDFFPTFCEAAGLPVPAGLDGASFLPLLRGRSMGGRDSVFCQIDKKAGGDAVPMRAVQDVDFLYIYNAWSDGKHRYRNYNEGLCMRAMEEAARTDPAVRARVRLFRYRVPEELYDMHCDRDCLHNLIDDPAYKKAAERMRRKLHSWMLRTKDPLREAFRNRGNRAAVDRILLRIYGPPQQGRAKPRRSSPVRKR